VGPKNPNDRSVEHKIGKLHKTADPTFKVECPNYHFRPLRKIHPQLKPSQFKVTSWGIITQ